MTQDQKHEEAIEAVEQLVETASTNWRRLAIIGTAVVLVLCVAGWFAYSKAQRPEMASYALFMAQSQSPQAIELVAQQYGDTFAGPASLVTLAAIAVSQTNYLEAIRYYRRLVAEHGDSYLVPAANLAIAECYMALGGNETEPAKRHELFAQAETVLKRELLYNRDHYAAFSAQLALVHVLVAQDRLLEARNELHVWDQAVGNSEIAMMADGLRERLMRVSGVVTNISSSVTTETKGATETQ